MLRKNESLNIYSIALFFVIFFGSSIFLRIGILINRDLS